MNGRITHPESNNPKEDTNSRLYSSEQTSFDGMLDSIPIHDQTAKWITAIFDHWITVHRTPKTGERRGIRPILSDARRRKIKQALQHYDIDTICLSIDGAKKSPWHQGENPGGLTYDELTLILRDPEHIEQFLTYNEQGNLYED